MFGRKKFVKKRKLKKPPIFLRGWFLAFVVFGLVCLVGSYIGFMSYTKQFREKAETYDLKKIRNVERPNIILDRNNDEVGRIFVENRDETTIELIPQKFINALVAGEDSRFYSHDGVDYIGIARAAKGNFQSGNADSGASTLTMQLARNVFPLQKDAEAEGGDKYDRKFVEIFLAHRIEKKYSKDQIMEFYVNLVPFGSGFYGVRSASLGYFGKEPADLTIPECASLVGCIKNPSVFSPIRNPKKHKGSRDNVLNRMHAEGFITTEQCEEFKSQAVVLNPKPIERGTSYFYDRVAQFVQEKVPEEQRQGGGLRIFTTLDKSLQDTLEEKIKNQLYLVEQREGYKHPKYADFKSEKGKKTNYLQGAGLCYNHKTGEVLAYVGGRDFRHSQYDFIQAGQRPLGTAFLPVVYAAAIENGGNLSQPLIDEAMDNRMVMVSGEEGILAEWGAEVLDPKYEGVIQSRQGLAHSKIAATVRLGKEIGLEKVNKTAQKFGFSMPRARVDRRVLTRGVIGSESTSVLKASQAYAAIGNKGEKPNELIWVTRIENQYGEVIYQSPREVSSQRILSERNAFILHSGLQDVWKKGNLAEAYKKVGEFSFNGGVKTGTTYNFADNWTLGYNGDVSCAVWAGFFSGNESIYPGAFAKDTVFPVWAAVMAEVSNRYSIKEISVPKDIVAVRVCSRSGLLCTNDCYETKRDAVSGKDSIISTGVLEFFPRGQEPSGLCDFHGDGAGDLQNIAITGGATARELLYVLPIKPKVTALLGSDPYNTHIPEFNPHGGDNSAQQIKGYGLILDKIDQFDREATMQQPRPARLKITD